MHPLICKVVLDANVLFPFTLRDTLLRMAAAGYYQLYWSQRILEEAKRNLVIKGVISEDQAARLFGKMQDAFPDALIEDDDVLEQTMPNDEKDRHVAATAVQAGAARVITFNLKDFKILPEGLSAQSPDVFLLEILAANPTEVIQLLRNQASALKKPAKTLEQLLDGLAKSVPRFVERVNEVLASAG